jgi:hypothetical protein
LSTREEVEAFVDDDLGETMSREEVDEALENARFRPLWLSKQVSILRWAEYMARIAEEIGLFTWISCRHRVQTASGNDYWQSMPIICSKGRSI